jgi:hypothetical protein
MTAIVGGLLAAACFSAAILSSARARVALLAFVSA